MLELLAEQVHVIFAYNCSVYTVCTGCKQVLQRECNRVTILRGCWTRTCQACLVLL